MSESQIAYLWMEVELYNSSSQLVSDVAWREFQLIACTHVDVENTLAPPWYVVNSRTLLYTGRCYPEICVEVSAGWAGLVLGMSSRVMLGTGDIRVDDLNHSLLTASSLTAVHIGGISLVYNDPPCHR